jgi:hypothetical protein
MTYSKRIKLEVQIEVNVPLDIIEDKHRFKAIEDGLVHCISKGLYEEGVSFRINKSSSKRSSKFTTSMKIIKFIVNQH